MEEEQNSSIEEVAPHDSESVVVESSEQPESAQPETSTAELEKKQERNWKETRRKQREAEMKIKAQEELIEKLLKSQNQPVQEKAPEPDEFANIAADDYLTKEQSERLAAKRAEEIAERKYRQMEAQREQERFMERLKSEYSDFTDVVNPDSIAILEEKVPKLAQTIADLKDPYKMGLQTYHYLKAMNLGPEASEKRHAKEVERKIEKNETIVQSPQAYNKRPMAQAFQSSKAEMSKLYEEMMGFASQAGSGY